MNYFEVLGLSIDASENEISNAYKRLAKQFHPDQHPEAGPAEKAAWGAMMARINEAWSVLGNEAKRDAHRRDLRSEQTKPEQEPTRAPRQGECELCGCAPAALFRYQHQVAYLFAAQLHGIQLELCSHCSLALGRSSQNRTLLLGWWGVLSFFRNLGIVFTNAAALRSANLMPRPKKVSTVVAPLRTSLEPGSPVLARLGFWVSAGVLVLGGVIAARTEKSDPVSSNTFQPVVAPGGTIPPLQAEWAVGSCVQGDSPPYPVSCFESHIGQIISRTSSSFDCPNWTESYFLDFPNVWCIDEDL